MHLNTQVILVHLLIYVRKSENQKYGFFSSFLPGLLELWWTYSVSELIAVVTYNVTTEHLKCGYCN